MKQFAIISGVHCNSYCSCGRQLDTNINSNYIYD